MRSLHCGLLTLVLLALLGCKIEITVPSGGSVESQSGAHTCASGDTCEIDVVDLFFDETFVARPAPGFSFHQWQRRPRGFCGGNHVPCHLFTSGFEGNDDLLAILASDEVFTLEPVFTETGPVTVTRNLVYSSSASGTVGERQLDIYAPREASARPVVVLLHGGTGNRQDAQYQDVSRQLAEAGFVVFAADHSARGTPASILKVNGARVRRGLEDVQCALRYAAEQAANFGGGPRRISVLGHSAGGVVGVIAVLGGEALDADLRAFEASHDTGPLARCVSRHPLPRPVGFAGFNAAMFVFDRRGFPTSDPELAALVDPHSYVGSEPQPLRLRFMLGSNDATTPEWHQEEVRQFAVELAERGYDAAAPTIDGAAHDFVTRGAAWDQTLAALRAVTGR